LEFRKKTPKVKVERLLEAIGSSRKVSTPLSFAPLKWEVQRFFKFSNRIKNY